MVLRSPSEPEFGVILPTTEIGDDPDVLRRYVRAAEEAGFDYLAIFDHVVGADTATRPDWTGPYTVEHPFHEPFVVLGFLAACSGLDLMTAVLVLPQRQAVLVAKQAAELDVLTGGRFRLGVGTGWNDLEYRALGVDFATRGRLMDEQIEVLRLLWTQGAVSFSGEFHDLDGVGIRPLPSRRPIPIWMGGDPAGPALRRISRAGDGWICRHPPTDEVRAAFAGVRQEAEALGRDPDGIGLQGMVQWGSRRVTLDEELREVEAWLTCGAARVSFSSARARRAPEEHIAWLADLATVLGRFR